MIETEQLLYNEEVVFILDNFSSHLNLQPMQVENHTLRYLSRYSPFLNTAEYAGSVVKQTVKRALGEQDLQREANDRVAAAAAGLTLHQHRIQILQREMERAMLEITEQKCRQFFNHVVTWTCLFALG